MILLRKILPLLLAVQHLPYQNKIFYSTSDYHKLIIKLNRKVSSKWLLAATLLFSLPFK